MSQEPPWERAERYRRKMQVHGSRSIRALARATGEDHSRLAKILKVLALPERVLEALRVHADYPRVRAHFSERRLRPTYFYYEDLMQHVVSVTTLETGGGKSRE